MNKKQGLLIVIDGIDGSGKTTQVEFLKGYLVSQGVAWEAISFPRYEDNIYGKLIRRYLLGEFGLISEVNSYLLALAFAGDRFLAKPLIEKWLSEGKLILANRYVSASYAHMGANLPEEKREDFFHWLDELEYKTNNLPKENLTILLTVDPETGQRNVAGRSTDIHEENLKHFEEASKIYLSLAKKESNWQIIDCMKNGKMKSPGEIQNEIRRIVNEKLQD